MRLSGLMQNLLTLARMDEGVKPVKTRVNLSEAVQKAVSDFAQSAELKNLQIQTRLEPECFIQADASQVLQLLSILADNAVKYAEPGGIILFETVKSGQKVKLRQSNPVPADAVLDNPERLFDRFYRQNEARTQSAGGYGIGLSAAQAIAEANGARISAAYPRNCVIQFTIEW